MNMKGLEDSLSVSMKVRVKAITNAVGYARAGSLLGIAAGTADRIAWGRNVQNGSMALAMMNIDKAEEILRAEGVKLEHKAEDEAATA